MSLFLGCVQPISLSPTKVQVQISPSFVRLPVPVLLSPVTVYDQTLLALTKVPAKIALASTRTKVWQNFTGPDRCVRPSFIVPKNICPNATVTHKSVHSQVSLSVARVYGIITLWNNGTFWWYILVLHKMNAIYGQKLCKTEWSRLFHQRHKLHHPCIKVHLWWNTTLTDPPFWNH